MIMRDRDKLIARIRQMRRAGGSAATAAAASTENPTSDRLDALQARIAHLESLIEGLQDSVHRESDRQGKLIAQLQAQVDPAAMSAAISRDARDRGL
jgi:uncharacterized coiled-coil protein SlyX